jgi:hypothetical protein
VFLPGCFCAVADIWVKWPGFSSTLFRDVRLMFMDYRFPTLILLMLWIGCGPMCQAETGILYQQTSYAWAGPMGVLDLADDWRGDLHPHGKDGFVWDQRSAGAYYNGLQVSYVYRQHAQYRFPWNAALGYYQYVHNADLDEEYRFHTRIEVEHYQGEGPAISYRFEGEHWYLTPGYNQLNLYKLYWGSLNGELYYQNSDHWGGDIQLDYGYTDDPIVRRELERRSYGTLHGLNLEGGWQQGNYQLDYQGYNLLARIDWSNMPYTKARVCTDCTFFLYGYEYFDDRYERPAAVHFVHQQYQLNTSLALTLNTVLNQIRNSWQPGIDWLAAGIHWQLAADIETGAMQVGIRHPNVQLSLMSELPDINASRLLQVNLGLKLGF